MTELVARLKESTDFRKDPFLLSVELHTRFARVHPILGRNGRMAPSTDELGFHLNELFFYADSSCGRQGQIF